MILIIDVPGGERPRAVVIIEGIGLLCELVPDGWDAIGVVHPDGRVNPVPPCFRLREDIRAELNVWEVS